MSLNKYRYKLTEIYPEECRGQKMIELLEDMKYSKNCLAIFQPYSGSVEYVLTGFNEDMLASLTVLMCSDENIYKFLKLALVSTEKFKSSWDKGFKFHNESVKYLRQHFKEIEL